MGYVNKKRVEPLVNVKSHLNWMGGTSFDINDPFVRLRTAAASCFFGEPQYYYREKGSKLGARLPNRSLFLSDTDVDYLRKTLDATDPRDWRGLAPNQIMEKSIDAALDVDIAKTLEIAVALRNEDHMRVTPQVIMVRAAMHKKSKGTSLIREYAPQIIKRADEPATQLAYFLSVYGKGAAIPNSLKKAWKAALERFNDYQLAKYRLEGHEVKTVDVVNLVHPKSEAVHKLVRGELKTTDQTWESIISAEGSNRASWEKAIDKMGHMALLRNVRNLLDKGVDVDLFLSKLRESAKTGQQLPFRYYSAYRAVQGQANGKVLDTIEECMEIALDNLPTFNGKVMSLCDNSGSARGATTSSMGTMQVATIGNLTGIITGKVADDGYVGVFGDKLEVVPIRKKASTLDQLEKLEKIGNGIGGATENGIWLFFDKAIKSKEHWDHIFVYSDMQAGHGGLYGVNASQYRDYLWRNSGNHIDVAKLVKTYRQKVNKNVMVYLVQIAGYTDALIPEFYDKTFILGGWGEGILKFAHQMQSNYSNQQ